MWINVMINQHQTLKSVPAYEEGRNVIATDANARGGLCICSYWDSEALETCAHFAPEHLATP